MNIIVRGAVAIGAVSAGLLAIPTTAMAGYGGASSTPASDNLVIQKVDATTGKLLTGARFTGQNCVRGASDLNVSCENLADYAWFRDNLPEFGTTPTYDGGFQNEIPITSSYDSAGNPATLATTNETVDITESVAPTGYARISETATVYRSGNIWKADNLPAGVTLTESNNYYYLRFADTPIAPVYPTQHTTTTPTKVVIKAPVPVQTGTKCTDPSTTYQVDSYMPTTAAQTAVLKHLAADKKLTWREDRALWGHSRHEFVTVKRSDVTRAGSLAAAINAKTRTVANLGGRIATGATYTTAWALTGTATIAQPWGATHTQNQVLYTAAPMATAVCTPIYTTKLINETTTKPVSTTTWVCPDGTVVPTATTVCRTAGGVGGSYGN